MVRTGSRATTFALLVAVACCALSSFANALDVVSPTKGDEIFAGRPYTVEWTDSSEGRFNIDLYMCGSYCMEDDCGEWVTALCPYAEDGCPDSAGDYDVVMPEPMAGTDGMMYKVRVENTRDESESGCSGGFDLVPSVEEPPVGPQYFLDVTSPMSGDVANAGEEYTIEWDYDDGLGSSIGRFNIALYPVGCTGGMVANLCDKPSIGCRDTTGDYDVVFPESLPSGMYSVRVGPTGDDTLFGCSDAFMVEGGSTGGDGDMSMSMRL